MFVDSNSMFWRFHGKTILQVFAAFMLIKGLMAVCTPRCQNGGECFSGICRCGANYTGSRCENENVCASGPCQNGGTCVALASNYLCSCPDGYSGRQCQYSLMAVCTPRCQNGGECFSGICRCGANYTGSRCENENACASGPCQNGGTCVGTASNYLCSCPAGYDGWQCQYIICTPPCQNGALCVSGTCMCSGSYTGNSCEIDRRAACAPPCQNGGECFSGICLCRENYTGSRCEYENACASGPCQNGGICTEWASSYVCSCPDGYDGWQCQYSICTPPCQNGRLCIRGMCLCSGKSCEIGDSWYSSTAPTQGKSTDSYNPLGLLLGVVLSSVAVAAVLGGIIWWKTHRRQQLRYPMGLPRHRLAANQIRRDSGLVLRLGSVSSCVEGAGHGGLQQPTGSGAGDGQRWADCGPMCGPYDPAMVDLPPAYSLVVNKPNYSLDPPPSYEEYVVAVAAATTKDGDQQHPSAWLRRPT